jgi:hypothetical protein
LQAGWQLKAHISRAAMTMGLRYDILGIAEHMSHDKSSCWKTSTSNILLSFCVAASLCPKLLNPYLQLPAPFT